MLREFQRFAAIDNYNQKKIAELYRLAWNLGEAPLLFVVTPEQLLIYNNYEKSIGVFCVFGRNL